MHTLQGQLTRSFLLQNSSLKSCTSVCACSVSTLTTPYRCSSRVPVLIASSQHIVQYVRCTSPWTSCNSELCSKLYCAVVQCTHVLGNPAKRACAGINSSEASVTSHRGTTRLPKWSTVERHCIVKIAAQDGKCLWASTLRKQGKAVKNKACEIVLRRGTASYLLQFSCLCTTLLRPHSVHSSLSVA